MTRGSERGGSRTRARPRRESGRGRGGGSFAAGRRKRDGCKPSGGGACQRRCGTKARVESERERKRLKSYYEASIGRRRSRRSRQSISALSAHALPRSHSHSTDCSEPTSSGLLAFTVAGCTRPLGYCRILDSNNKFLRAWPRAKRRKRPRRMSVRTPVGEKLADLTRPAPLPRPGPPNENPALQRRYHRKGSESHVREKRRVC